MTDPQQKAAYIMSQTACALATVAGMQAENALRAFNNLEPMYLKGDFDGVLNQFGVHHNAVCTFLQD